MLWAGQGHRASAALRCPCPCWGLSWTLSQRAGTDTELDARLWVWGAAGVVRPLPPTSHSALTAQLAPHPPAFSTTACLCSGTARAALFPISDVLGLVQLRDGGGELGLLFTAVWGV